MFPKPPPLVQSSFRLFSPAQSEKMWTGVTPMPTIKYHHPHNFCSYALGWICTDYRDSLVRPPSLLILVANCVLASMPYRRYYRDGI